MKRPYLFFFSLLLSALQTGTVALAGETVTWMEADAPLFFIHTGEFKGQGYEDIVTDILQENLPEYSHETMSANLSRHMYNFKHGQDVCNVGLYRKLYNQVFITSTESSL